VFSKPEVSELLNKYTLVELYTDAVPSRYQPTTSADDNRELLNEKFKTGQLPFYAILKPAGQGKYEVIATYKEGKINDVGGFTRFLQNPLLSQGGGLAQAAAK
jgi:hypothetical protein